MLLRGDAADNAILPAEIVVDEDLARVAPGQQVNEAAKDGRVHPIAVDHEWDVDRLARALEPQPRLLPLDVDMILDLRERQRALRHRRHSLGDADIAALAVDAFRVEMPEIVAVRPPRRRLL